MEKGVLKNNSNNSAPLASFIPVIVQKLENNRQTRSALSVVSEGEEDPDKGSSESWLKVYKTRQKGIQYEL